MNYLSGYIAPVISACMVFVPMAALFTLPFMIWQYRKFGTIPILRVLVIYSFMLYMTCAFLLTVLPLPEFEKVAAMKPITPQLIPFSSYYDAFTNPDGMGNGLFEIGANIVMQIPLGVYLRYYYRRSLKQVLLIGFAVSLFYELTQLSGLFFIYPKAYRVCSVDDLIDNTLGAVIGYWITPLLTAFLPSRERLDSISMARARRITLIRRLTSAVIDWLIYFAAFGAFIVLVPGDSGTAFGAFLISAPAYVIAVFVLWQRYMGGQSLGKVLLNISVRDRRTGDVPTVRQLAGRYFLIYAVLPAAGIAAVLGSAFALIAAVFAETALIRFIAILTGSAIVIVTVSVIAVILRKHGEFPHSFMSHTYIADTRRRAVRLWRSNR